MPAKKSSRKRTTAKKSTATRSAGRKSTARKSSAKKSAGKKSTAKRSKKKSPVAKIVANPKRTARTAVKVARKTAERTREVGETMVGASDLVKKAIDAVDTIVSGKPRSRRSRGSGKSGGSESR